LLAITFPVIVPSGRPVGVGDPTGVDCVAVGVADSAGVGVDVAEPSNHWKVETI